MTDLKSLMSSPANCIFLCMYFLNKNRSGVLYHWPNDRSAVCWSDITWLNRLDENKTLLLLSLPLF